MPSEILESIERAFALSDQPNVSPVTVGGNYAQAHNHPAGINARYAAEALTSGRVERWSSSDSHVTLACRYIDRDRPYTQVVFATENPPAVTGTSISFAWRLYGAAEDVRPTEAFAEILARYGAGVRCGDREGLFLALETIEGGNMQLEPAVETLGNNSFSVSGFIQRLPGGYVQLTWAFCVDDTAYIEDVRRHRG